MPTKTHILTHRGLDPSKKSYFLESSKESFEDQLMRGFGLEVDIQTTKDEDLIIFHDTDLKRITKGKIETAFKDLNSEEVKILKLDDCHILDLSRFCELVSKSNSEELVAIHLKSKSQTPVLINKLIYILNKWKRFDNTIIFDVKIESAKYIKSQNNKIKLAASVAHEYDVERYNGVTGETLWKIEDVLSHRELFNWVWFDEWDRKNKEGNKIFYTEENFKKIRSAGLKIALVTPELHKNSPGLLGGEMHEDAANHEQLMKRIQEILYLYPDALCTDYPDEVRKMIQCMNNEKYETIS